MEVVMGDGGSARHSKQQLVNVDDDNYNGSNSNNGSNDNNKTTTMSAVLKGQHINDVEGKGGKKTDSIDL